VATNRDVRAYVERVMHDELAILRVLAQYCHTIDDGAFDEFAEHWAGDAEFVLRGTVTRGRDAIRDTIAAMQPLERRGRHLTMNPVVDLDYDIVLQEALKLLHGDGPVIP